LFPGTKALPNKPLQAHLLLHGSCLDDHSLFSLELEVTGSPAFAWFALKSAKDLKELRDLLINSAVHMDSKSVHLLETC